MKLIIVLKKLMKNLKLMKIQVKVNLKLNNKVMMVVSLIKYLRRRKLHLMLV